MSADVNSDRKREGDVNVASARSKARKNEREKQRRQDMRNVVDDIKDFLIANYPITGEDSEIRKSRKQGESDIEWLTRSLKTLKRLHSENEQNKMRIARMEEAMGRGNPNDNVSQSS